MNPHQPTCPTCTNPELALDGESTSLYICNIHELTRLTGGGRRVTGLETSMSDGAIIQRVRQEHERLDTIKAILEEAVQVPDPLDADAWLQNLRKHFEHFRAHLIHRFALEEIGGFLNVVVERRPTLAAQVDDLRDGHQHLIELVGSTMETLRNATADSETVDSSALLVLMTLSRIKYHEEAEQLLVSHVFTQEIGVGD